MVVPGNNSRMRNRDQQRVGRFLFTWLVNAVALGVAAWLVGHVSFSSYIALAAAGLVFVLGNMYLKPVLVFLGIPFIVITLGLGLFFINMFMVWLTAVIVPGFDASGFWPIAEAAVVIWLTNLLLSGLWPKPSRTQTWVAWTRQEL